MPRTVRVVVLLVVAVAGASVLIGRYVKQHSKPDGGRVLTRNVADDGTHTLSVISAPYTLDRLYRSMHGPFSAQPNVKLSESGSDELIWVTGIEAQVVDAQTLAPTSAEFFCHGNVALSYPNAPRLHNERFGGATHMDWRLFTLVPGKLSIRLPEGFGIPMRGGESIDVDSMTLNMTSPDKTVRVRVRADVQFVKDSTTAAMKPVFRRSLYGLMPLGEAKLPPQLTAANKDACTTCGPHPGESASKGGILGQFGPNMTIHWMVPPGRFEYRTEVTKQLDLPFDTTVHLITAHLHPFGKSVTLRDMTTGETIATLTGQSYKDKLGVAHMDELASREGIALKRDHRYELVTIYENTSGKDTDAMSIVYLYLLEKDFAPQARQAAASRPSGDIIE